MKICITAEGDRLDAQVDQHFGRCRYFIFYDIDSSQVEAVQNENASGMGGVGVRSAQFVGEKKAKAVLTGQVGPNAAKALRTAKIDVIVDVSGSVREAIERYKNGEFEPSEGPNTDAKSGLNN